MAKGFKVKAATPTVAKDDFDIEAVKAHLQGKKIVFCMPGRGCSYTFLKNFVQLSFDLVQSGAAIPVSYTHLTLPTICSV